MAAIVFAAACAPSEATASLEPLLNESAPVLGGVAAVGGTLSCSTGSWQAGADEFGYVWLRDGQPIGGQTASTYVVQQADEGHSLSCQVTAAAGAGSYAIDRLPTGTFDLKFLSGSLDEFGAGNFAPIFFQQALVQRQATGVQVTAGAVTSGIDAQMSIGGEIEGRVTDQTTHAALSGVSVCASLGGLGGACTETNQAGEYRLSGLSSGGYTVSFELRFGSHEGPSWTESYDGGAIVPVEAGRVASGVDAEIETGQIEGMVISAAGKAPLAGVGVCARMPQKLVHVCARTNANGEYVIAWLHPGSYDVEFSTAGFDGGNYASQYYSGSATPSATGEVVVVAGAGRSGVDAQLQQGGQITGTVKSERTKTPLEATVCATLVSGSEASFCAKSGAAGGYTIGGLMSGSYRVHFSPPESAGSDYLGAYFDGKAQIDEATAVPVTAGQDTGEVNAELLLGGQISGIVTSAATGAALADVTVCSLETSGVGVGYSNRCAQTDAAGVYTLFGIPGESAAVSFQPSAATGNYLGQLYSEQVHIASATKVSLAPGASREGIDARLLGGGEITGRVTSVAGTGIAGVLVCAEGAGNEQEAIRYQTEDETGECAVSSGVIASGSATSSEAAIPLDGPTSKPPEGRLRLLKMRYDIRAGKLVFLFAVPAPGHLAWKLSFDSAAAGFVAMGGQGAVGMGAGAGARGHAARHATRCRKGRIRHDRRCAPVLVRFARGGRDVPAGRVEVEVRPGAAARKALAAARKLHVTGEFELRSRARRSQSRSVSIEIQRRRCRARHQPKRDRGRTSRCVSP